MKTSGLGVSVVTHILPEVFIYLECSQRPKELQLGKLTPVEFEVVHVGSVALAA